MASAAPSSGDQPNKETAVAETPATTTTVTNHQSGSDKPVPTPVESTEKPQIANSQAGHEDDEDSEFDELDGKHYLSIPRHHSPHHTTLVLCPFCDH